MINLNFNGEEIRWLVFSNAVEKKYRFYRSISWMYSGADPEIPPAPLQIQMYSPGYGASALEWSGKASIELVRNNSCEIRASIFALEKELLTEVENLLKTWFPEIESEEDDLTVVFWSYSPNGPRCYRRSLLSPSWESIENNYAASTREALVFLRDVHPGAESGKLILWTGSPGTGKSWALRGLARAWRSWCRVHYILDPERFFGEHADYLVQVLLGEDDFTPTPVDVPIHMWRLIVLEDTGELLSADAKVRSGQGLSRLLNVCDGMIGQGLRVLVLITTNEEIGELHKAVVRPGRCLANIEFRSFNREEAQVWLAEHGLAGSARPEISTLASLYSVLAEKGVIQNFEQKHAAGFMAK